MTEEQNKLADRLEAMLDQVGHPDYSLKEFYDGLKLIVWELRQEREPATEAVLEARTMSEVTAPVTAAPGAFNLSEFVNAADIGGADSPHQVVYKLQRAINAALKGKGASQGDPHDELVFDGQGDPEGPGAPKPPSASPAGSEHEPVDFIERGEPMDNADPTPAERKPSKWERFTRSLRWWFRNWREDRKRHRDVLACLNTLKRGSEKDLRELDIPWPRSEDDLLRIIRAVAKREHDYGTCVYAMSISAEAAFNYISHVLGVTGFQASCADMNFLRRTRGWKVGFQILNYENLLYPQYLDREHFPTHDDLIRENIEELGKKAGELLAERDHAHSEVSRWWNDLVDMRAVAKQKLQGAVK